MPLDIAVRSRYFGRKACGAMQGLSFAFSAPVGFLAPIYVGRMYDVSKSYSMAFMPFAIVGAIGAVAMVFVRPPGQPYGGVSTLPARSRPCPPGAWLCHSA